jgi:predicted nucleotidyltransferase
VAEAASAADSKRAFSEGGGIIMAKAPKKPEEIFSAFRDDLKNTFGDDLISIILFGSGATGEYVPGKSDLNFLVVLTDDSVDSLRKAMDTVARWRKKRVNTPLFMTPEYISSSLDSYPIEFLDITANYRLVYGKDVLQDLHFQPTEVRVQCERELKGKLLHLRQAYLESEEKTKNLREIVSASITTFISIFQGLLYLKKMAIPRTKEEIVQKVAAEFQMNAPIFLRLLEIRKGSVKVSAQELSELFSNYISEIEALSDSVDKLVLKQEGEQI